eukprot:5147862-Alexandrium_andersonii.AAC.1
MARPPLRSPSPAQRRLPSAGPFSSSSPAWPFSSSRTEWNRRLQSATSPTQRGTCAAPPRSACPRRACA